MTLFKKILSIFNQTNDMNKFLILGIGNIGLEYEDTRHNVGFEVLDKLADQLDTKFESVKLAQRAEGKIKGKKVVLIKPINYVNNSGKSLFYWLKKEKISIQNILVICDDLNLYFGNIKLKSSGSSGGHNGLKDIEKHLETYNYPRLRIGISNNEKVSKTDYVLGKWNKFEKSKIDIISISAIDIIYSFIQVGIETTMNSFNKKNFI